ncbi:hypothetical protein BC830DRAFT_766482 [Chytriomyces sp. MP71]|nr:hypothetical protein BC830DRAFT_766482 [Chytriomyces sp. MP71]
MGTVKTNHHILGLQVKAVPEDSKSLSSRETSDDMDHLESTQQDVAVKEEYPKEAPTIPQTQQLSQVSDLPGVLRILHQEGFVADIGGPNTVNSIVVNGPVETAKPVMDTETLLCDSQVTSAEPFLPDNVMHNGQDGSQAPESPELGLLHSASLRISKRKMNQSQVSSSLSQLSSAFDSPLETMAPKHKLVVVDCQCGCTIIDMPMIQCRNCSSLSHPPCYAYESDKDFRIPSDGHLCYKCWNSIIHPSSYNLEEAANIALIRRGLFLAFRDGGIASINAFAGIIGTCHETPSSPSPETFNKIVHPLIRRITNKQQTNQVPACPLRNTWPKR